MAEATGLCFNREWEAIPFGGWHSLKALGAVVREREHRPMQWIAEARAEPDITILEQVQHGMIQARTFLPDGHLFISDVPAHSRLLALPRLVGVGLKLVRNGKSVGQASKLAGCLPAPGSRVSAIGHAPARRFLVGYSRSTC